MMQKRVRVKNTHGNLCNPTICRLQSKSTRFVQGSEALKVANLGVKIDTCSYKHCRLLYDN